MLCYACSFRWLRSVPRRSDHSLDGQITPWTVKSIPRPSDYKSCYACLLCLFISIAQITPQTLRSLSGRSNHTPDPQTKSLAMLVHFDGSDHPLDAQVAPWTLKSLPGRSNHCPDLQITSLAMLCLFISIAQITPQMLRSLPGRSN